MTASGCLQSNNQDKGAHWLAALDAGCGPAPVAGEQPHRVARSLSVALGVAQDEQSVKISHFLDNVSGRVLQALPRPVAITFA
jgi:hypothetical protein